MDAQLDTWHQTLTHDPPGQDYEPLVSLITGLDKDQLVQHVSKLQPLSLRLLDHHHVPNKLLALRAIAHLMHNLPADLMSSTGSDLLFLHSLKSCLVHEEMLVTLVPLLIQAMVQAKVDAVSETADDVTLAIVRGLDLGTAVSSKLIFWKSVRLVMDFVGLAIIRVGKRMVRRMTDHLTYPLTPESDQMFCELLLAADSFVRITKERGDRFCPELLFAVSAFCYSNYQAVRTSDQIMRHVRRLMQSLSQVHPVAFDHVLRVVQQNDPEDRMSLLFKDLNCQAQTLLTPDVVTTSSHSVKVTT